jgi:uncharacterized protein (TIGR00156 family)
LDVRFQAAPADLDSSERSVGANYFNQSGKNMKNKLPLVLALFVGCLFVSTASAQETDTTGTMEETVENTAAVAEDTSTVSEDLVDVAYVVDEAPDDMSVTLRGQLTQSLGEEGYVFQDESGVVHVRIDDDVLSADQFTEGMEVEILGEVDKDEGELTVVEVEMVTVI